MKQIDAHETRLIERTSRANPEAQSDLQKELDALPDLADRVAKPTEEQVAEFRTQILAEEAARRDRIARFIEEAKAPPAPRPPVTPVNEAEL